MSSYDCLEVEQRESVRWIFLNRPRQRNALNRTMIDELREQIHLAEADHATSVVAVAGNGPSFSAGGDFRQFLELDDQGRNPVEFLSDVTDCFSRIEASPVPWVAVLHGHAVAGGLELALACDVVIAAENTLIGDGHLNNGLLPAGGSSVRLPKAVGTGLAQWLLLTGELMPARVFADAGWILRVIPDDDLRTTAEAVCSTLASRAGEAQRRLKAHLHNIAGMDSACALQRELDAFADNWSTGLPAYALRNFLDIRTTTRDAS